jgi:SP family xylose:H+ symportor-like MFS transporter
MSEKKDGMLVVILTSIATLGGLLFGYDTAVISGAVSSIDINFVDPLNLPETLRNSLSGFTISSALFGCIIGGSVAGALGDRFGRRNGLVFAAVLFVLSAIGSALPEVGFGTIGEMGPRALVPFVCYRIICGVGVGIASLLSPLYIAEIAPKSTRGRLVSCNQLAIIMGMVVVYFVNWAIALQGSEEWLHAVGWRLMLGSEAIPAVIFLGLLMTVPETPRWLMMHGREAAAHAVLTRLGSESDIDAVVAEIRASVAEKSGRLLSFGFKVIVVGIMISVFQQLVGINAILYYAPLMFKNMGATTDSALLQTIVVGVANASFTCVAIFTVDRIGRKPLMIIGAAIMAVSMIVIGLLFNLQMVGLGALVAVVAYIAGFAVSWGPVAWVLLAEIFPAPIKGTALAIAVAAQWIANLGVSWTFKVLDGNSVLNAHFNHGFAYYFYGIMSVLAALFVYRYVPETKGKSLEQMEQLWGPGAKAGA